MRDCWARGLLCLQGTAGLPAQMRRSDTDPAQLPAGRAHRDRERPRRRRHRPGRRALSRPPDPRALRRCRRGTPRAPGLRRRAGVVAARPRYIARVADFDDTGEARAAGTAGGWQAVEWDLVGPFGINAPGAWTAAAGRGEGRSGRQVAVVDTGVAYSNAAPYRRSPDLPAARMRPGYDFVAHDAFPNDRNGHGTFVASRPSRRPRTTISAWSGSPTGRHHARAGPRLPGRREPGAIASGIRYAVDHGAQVINLSVEFFDCSRTAVDHHQPPDVRDAIRYAGEHGVARRRRGGQLSEAEIPSRVLDNCDHLRRGDDRARVPRRLLELRSRRRPRRARAAAPTRRCPAIPTARPPAAPGATSSR